MQDLALLADDERVSFGKGDQRNLDPVLANQLATRIGDEGKLGTNLLTKCLVLGLLV